MKRTERQTQNDFSRGSMARNILQMALPMTVAQLINILYNVVDRMYLGKLPGHLSLTGLGLCLPIISILMGFANLCGMGGAPLCSIHRGKGEDGEAERILGNSFALLLLFGAGLTALGLAFRRPILYLFGASDLTFPYANDYLTIYLLGTLFVMIGLGMNPFINAQGFSRMGMMTVALGAVVNIVLDPIFIFALDMGVRGAALATVLAQGCSALWVLKFLTGSKTKWHLRREHLRPQAKVVLPALALGASPFIMQSTESLITVCFNSSLLKYGGDLAVGAMTILTSVMQFAMLPLQGLAQGAQPIISYNYGAGNSNRVRRAYRLLLTCSVCYAMLFCLLIQLFPGVFAAIFTSNAELLAFTKPMLRIYTLALGLFGIQIACQMTFTALGNAKASIIVAVMRKFILLLPLIYMMPHLYTADLTKAVFMAEPVADVLAVAFTGVLFFFEFRKALRAMPKSEKKS